MFEFFSVSKKFYVAWAQSIFFLSLAVPDAKEIKVHSYKHKRLGK